MSAKRKAADPIVYNHADADAVSIVPLSASVTKVKRATDPSKKVMPPMR